MYYTYIIRSKTVNGLWARKREPLIQISNEDYLLSLEKSTYSKVLKQIKLLEKFGHQLSMPYSKPISHNLYELRVRGRQEIRIFYCFHNDQVYLLHAFIKKTQKTSRHEIDLAQKRILLLT